MNLGATCPAPGCHRPTAGKLACPDHWRQLPEPIQRRLRAHAIAGNTTLLDATFAAARHWWKTEGTKTP